MFLYKNRQNLSVKFDWRIIGHEKILNKLERDIENNNIASATLFVGPAEIGKSRVCKTFAKILQCGELFSYDHEISKQIEKNIFSDVVIVDLLWQKDKMENFDIIGKSSNFDQSHRKKNNMRSDTISIDDVRAFSERLYEKPNANYKICYIKNAHRMKKEAANAFLKILEEPPTKTIFLLTATHENLLPSTVVSRTRVLQMNLVPRKIIENYLEENYPNMKTEEKNEILTLTQGRPARLQRFLENPDFLLSEREFFHEISNVFLQKTPSERMIYAENLAKNEIEITEFFDRFLHFLRSILMEKIQEKNLPIASKLTYDEINNIIENANLAKKRIFNNVNKRIVLENLFLSLP